MSLSRGVRSTQQTPDTSAVDVPVLGGFRTCLRAGPIDGRSKDPQSPPSVLVRQRMPPKPPSPLKPSLSLPDNYHHVRPINDKIFRSSLSLNALSMTSISHIQPSISIVSSDGGVGSCPNSPTPSETMKNIRSLSMNALPPRPATRQYRIPSTGIRKPQHSLEKPEPSIHSTLTSDDDDFEVSDAEKDVRHHRSSLSRQPGFDDELSEGSSSESPPIVSSVYLARAGSMKRPSNSVATVQALTSPSASTPPKLNGMFWGSRSRVHLRTSPDKVSKTRPLDTLRPDGQPNTSETSRSPATGSDQSEISRYTISTATLSKFDAFCLASAAVKADCESNGLRFSPNTKFRPYVSPVISQMRMLQGK